MADDIRRWSDELAREPGSLVFLQLGEALRRQGQLEIALKIALRGLERHPHNVDAHDLVARIAVDRRDFARAFEEWEAVLDSSPTTSAAMKGLGYLCFQYGRFAEAEWYLGRAAVAGGGSDVTSALETVRRTIRRDSSAAGGGGDRRSTGDAGRSAVAVRRSARRRRADGAAARRERLRARRPVRRSGRATI